MLGERDASGRTCRFYDLGAQSFADPDDALLRRAYLYDRRLDLYHSPEGEVAERTLTEPMAPGDPESRFSDERFLQALDDFGDSALWTATAGLSAAFRYAATGTDADLARLTRFARASASQFDATGMDGYLGRFHFEGVPAGTPIRNGRAMVVQRSDAFDIPDGALPQMPDYYREGRPSWLGNPSIDQYSGPLAFYPLAFALLQDAPLKARLARHYACFLKRLRPLHLFNLSQNPALREILSAYLAAGVWHPAPDEPDLTQLDEIWGLYLPRYSAASAGAYPRACPDTLAADAAPEDVLDATAPDFAGHLARLIVRQDPDVVNADSMDFVFYPSVRASDAVILLEAALGAYYLTGDAAFLGWRDQMLVTRADAREVATTMDALTLPKACTSYFRGHNVATAQYVALLLEGDAAAKARGADLWRRKFASLAAEGNLVFSLMGWAALGDAAPDALDMLSAFGGSEGHLDDPRRNYDVDDQASPLPGNPTAPPSAPDVALCEQGFDVFGFHVPGPPVSPGQVLAQDPLPPLLREPRGYLWEGDPFQAVRHFGADQGKQEYPGIDLAEPYWLARAHRLTADPHIVLAWGP